MSWTNINRVLSNVKNRPRIKNRFRIEVFKNILQNEINSSNTELSIGESDIKKFSFRDGMLTVEIKSSLLMQEIFLKKEEIRKEINRHLKKETVKEIIVRMF